MKINKAYKFRLYPTNEQKILINKTFGCTRLVYNYYLNKKQKVYKNENINLSSYDCIKDLVITSDGKKYDNNKTISKYEKRIQRKLSKKTKGSNNYYKTKTS